MFREGSYSLMYNIRQRQHRGIMKYQNTTVKQNTFRNNANIFLKRENFILLEHKNFRGIPAEILMLLPLPREPQNYTLKREKWIKRATPVPRDFHSEH